MMTHKRGEEIMRTVLQQYGFDVDGMPRFQALVKAAAIAGVELLRRANGEAPRLPFTWRELEEFMAWAEDEKELARYGTFTTAYDLLARSDGNAVPEG